MLLKKIFGVLILVLNFAGICYLLYVGTVFIWNEYFVFEKSDDSAPKPNRKKKPKIENDDIVIDEDDLLKDMDLSDLDDLDLEDFD